MSRSVRRSSATLLALSLVLTTGLSAPAASSPGTASLSLSKDVGPPGSSITADGTGFGASEKVDLTFDVASIGTALTDPSGAFSASVTIPPWALPRRHSITATGETSAMSATATFLVRTDWPMYQFNAKHSGYEPHENVLSPANVASLALLWHAQVGGFPGQPVVAGGRVFVGTSTGHLFAFDARDGTQLWDTFLGGTIRAAPAVSGNRVFVPSSNSRLSAVNASTGAVLWVKSQGFKTAVVAAGGLLYVSSAHGIVYALLPRSGRIIWRASAGYYPQTPTVGGGRVFVTSSTDAGTVRAYDATTGAPLWNALVESAGATAASLADDTLYVAGFDQAIHALDAATGTLLWSNCPCEFEGDSEVTPALALGLALVAPVDSIFGGGTVDAFDATTGDVAWSTVVDADFPYSATVAGGVVFWPSTCECYGRLYLLDASTGSVISTIVNRHSQFASSAVVVNGLVYLTTRAGRLNAYGLP